MAINVASGINPSMIGSAAFATGESRQRAGAEAELVRYMQQRALMGERFNQQMAAMGRTYNIGNQVAYTLPMGRNRPGFIQPSRSNRNARQENFDVIRAGQNTPRKWRDFQRADAHPTDANLRGFERKWGTTPKVTNPQPLARSSDTWEDPQITAYDEGLDRYGVRGQLVRRTNARINEGATSEYARDTAQQEYRQYRNLMRMTPAERARYVAQANADEQQARQMAAQQELLQYRNNLARGDLEARYAREDEIAARNRGFALEDRAADFLQRQFSTETDAKRRETERSLEALDRHLMNIATKGGYKAEDMPAAYKRAENLAILAGVPPEQAMLRYRLGVIMPPPTEEAPDDPWANVVT